MYSWNKGRLKTLLVRLQATRQTVQGQDVQGDGGTGVHKEARLGKVRWVRYLGTVGVL